MFSAIRSPSQSARSVWSLTWSALYGCTSTLNPFRLRMSQGTTSPN